MRNDLARHRVESALIAQGWSVYRLALGDGPALCAARGERIIRVAVASAIENERGAYPPWPRAGDAEILASVTAAGGVSFADPLSRSQASSVDDLRSPSGRLRGRPWRCQRPANRAVVHRDDQLAGGCGPRRHPGTRLGAVDPTRSGEEG